MKNQPEDTFRKSPEDDAFQRWRRSTPVFLSLAALPTISRPILIGAWSLAVTASVIAETWMWTKGMFLTDSNWAKGLIPIGIVIYFSALNSMLNAMKRLATFRLITERASVKAVRKSEQLQETLQDDFFTNLVKINFKYIDQYYLQTQLQADKSFTLCLISSLVGLVIIGIGILLLFLDHDNLQPGYVATASGTLSEFIAAVFFYLYNQTIVKMGQYHQKLVLTQNISLALKIAEELPPAEQVIARMNLIGYLSADINRYLTLPVGSEGK